jgi:hypothetical protein
MNQAFVNDSRLSYEPLHRNGPMLSRLESNLASSSPEASLCTEHTGPYGYNFSRDDKQRTYDRGIGVRFQSIHSDSTAHIKPTEDLTEGGDFPQSASRRLSVCIAIAALTASLGLITDT